MNYHDLMHRIQEEMINEDGAAATQGSATTMDAISYLPTQVGTVRSAIKKLKKHKPKWNLEILENEDGYVVKLSAFVPIKFGDETNIVGSIEN
ncbi:MAG: hypothetical protein ACFFDT_10055 [Candidatus Hodarchaeota archaeon]